MNERVDDILLYWFGENKNDHSQERSKKWFMGGPEIDQEIIHRYKADVEAAIRGELVDWEKEPQSLLALVILLDQFSRNIYRDSPQAFAQDPKALELSLSAIEKKWDQQLDPIERVFLYLPIEHSEEMAMQQKSVALFKQLAQDVNADQKEIYENFHHFALRHLEVIEKFGRFPGTNAALGRESTEAEKEYIAKTGSAF